MSTSGSTYVSYYKIGSFYLIECVDVDSIDFVDRPLIVGEEMLLAKRSGIASESNSYAFPHPTFSSPSSSSKAKLAFVSPPNTFNSLASTTSTSKYPHTPAFFLSSPPQTLPNQPPPGRTWAAHLCQP
ncbi:hypothetical protein GW17_00020897 [Ensete ventricosum]|nr:hypothetical protein GW17_00020897 [Ensete ventricosum]